MEVKIDILKLYDYLRNGNHSVLSTRGKARNTGFVLVLFRSNVNHKVVFCRYEIKSLGRSKLTYKETESSKS